MTDLIAAKNQAYSERNALVAFLARVYGSHLARHPDSEEWEDDWRWIVCIHGPQGQMSWHIHDSERSMFDHLEVLPNDWDGHCTEEKYQRLARLP